MIFIDFPYPNWNLLWGPECSLWHFTNYSFNVDIVTVNVAISWHMKFFGYHFTVKASGKKSYIFEMFF